MHRGALHPRRQTGAPLPGRARRAAALGCASTIEYLAQCARIVLGETGLLPHLNPGVMTREELDLLRPVRPRWESCSRPSPIGCRRREAPTGRPPTKCRRPASRRSASPARRRYRSRAASWSASARRVPSGSTHCSPSGRSGIAYGHLGEVIIAELPGQARYQDGGPRRRSVRGAAVDGCGGARPPRGRLACPGAPNLAYDEFPRLLDAGIDDWGGVRPSPSTTSIPRPLGP